MKLAFYRGGKSLFSKIIFLKQLLALKKEYARYTHVELIFSDGKWFSSRESTKKEEKGVSFIPEPQDASEYDFIDVGDVDEEKIKKWCDKQCGKKYDWIGILFSQGLRMDIQRKDKWFCSEICARALQEGKKLCTISAHFVSPGKLLYLLQNPDD